MVKLCTAQDGPYISRSLPRSWEAWECCNIFLPYFFRAFRELSWPHSEVSNISWGLFGNKVFIASQLYGWEQRDEPTTLFHQQDTLFVFKGFWALLGGCSEDFVILTITQGGSNCNVDLFSLDLPNQMVRGQFLSWKQVNVNTSDKDQD